MRRVVALVAAFVVACASIGAPPGGPERKTPPVLKNVEPESGTVNVQPRAEVFTFDEVVSDRGAGGDIESFFVLSPQEGTPRIGWHRDRIDVRARHGFRPNTAYNVTMLPGITDQRGNVLRTGRTVIFSTGPTIPVYFVLGRVFDWLNEKPAPKAWVEVIRMPDSLPYVGVADSVGQFMIGPLNPGSYSVRATVDVNARAFDPGKPWDTVSVVVASTSPFVEVLAAPRDTIAPRLLTVSASDSVTLVSNFDRPLDPDDPRTPESFRVTASDSARLRVLRVRTRAQADSEQRAAQDSAARAARADTTKRVAPPAGQAPTPPTPPTPPTAARDTAQLRRIATAPVKPSKPAPPRDFILRLDSLTPLRPGSSYRVTAIDIRGLTGRRRTSERVITIPRPAPPTRPKSDTTKGRLPPSPSPSPTRPPGRPPSP